MTSQSKRDKVDIGQSWCQKALSKQRLKGAMENAQTKVCHRHKVFTVNIPNVPIERVSNKPQSRQYFTVLHTWKLWKSHDDNPVVLPELLVLLVLSRKSRRVLGLGDCWTPALHHKTGVSNLGISGLIQQADD